MVILAGFPPSNTIQEGIRLPIIEKTKMTVGCLEKEDRFTHKGASFFVLGQESQVCMSVETIRALCYRGSKKSGSASGHVYNFMNYVEVIWLKEVWK